MGESALALATRLAGGPDALVAELGLDFVQTLLRQWSAVARPEQLPPDGDWKTWLVLAGRGFGKTRTGAEWSKDEIERGARRRIALVGPTAADVRDVMVEGESGIMALYARAPHLSRPIYEPSKRRITWPSGALATLFSAEEPDRLRGPQHDGFWADEIAAWDDPQSCWDQLQFGLRLGRHPRGIVTSTPRPIPLVRALVADTTVAVTRGSTFDNTANLAASFITTIKTKYEGTRLGRQELYAEILDDNPGALWKWADIEKARVAIAPEFKRVAGAIDPAVSSQEDSDETGIIFGGRASCRCKGTPEDHAFIIADRSGIYTPDKWAREVARGYREFECDRIVAEVNNGGDLVESTLRTLGDREISYRAVHASRGKQIRAEPIAALYEQGKVHHVGAFPRLEDQMTQWNPIDSWSPDRVDALVWLLTELMMGPTPWTGTKVRTAAPRRI